jgi:hypothetical protein
MLALSQMARAKIGVYHFDYLAINLLQSGATFLFSVAAHGLGRCTSAICSAAASPVPHRASEPEYESSGGAGDKASNEGLAGACC